MANKKNNQKVQTKKAEKPMNKPAKKTAQPQNKTPKNPAKNKNVNAGPKKTVRTKKVQIQETSTYPACVLFECLKETKAFKIGKYTVKKDYVLGAVVAVAIIALLCVLF